jgi:hypothetical protein
MKNRLAILFPAAMFIAMPLVKAQTPATPPNPDILKDTSNYKKYEGNMKEYLAWSIKTPFVDRDTALWRKVDEFIFAWITGSPDVTVEVGAVIEPILKDKKDKAGFELLIAYMGGVALYQLNNPTDKDEANIEYAGVKAVLVMANSNGDIFANAKAVKKYRSMDEVALKKYVQDCVVKDRKK